MQPKERNELISEIVNALPRHQLSDEEVHYVKMAIKRESQKIEFRNAVIEKTISGLVWAGLVGLGAVIVDFLKSHGIK